MINGRGTWVRPRVAGNPSLTLAGPLGPATCFKLTALNSLDVLSVDQITLRKQVCPLTKPYVLSFATLEEFVSLQVTIETAKGDRHTAEVVPLLGYSDESEDSIEAYLREKTAFIKGKELGYARDLIAKDIPQTPFACSPILTAIDLFHYGLETPVNRDIPFVIPTATQKVPALLQTVKDHQDATIKIKLSGDPKTDIAAFEQLEQQALSPNLIFRLDANQAYDLTGARTFFQYLQNSPLLPQIAYVEQPMDVDAWDEHETLAGEFPTVAVMLDESVITMEQLKDTKRRGIDIVKLKLFKQGGIRETLVMAEAAVAMGMKVVLGNGVATAVSNDIEISLHQRYPQLFYGASEANGFLKVKDL